MDCNEVRRIAAGWVQLHIGPKNGRLEDNRHFFAFIQLDGLIRCSPEDAWKVIEAIWKLDSSDWILANLAAGPMEDLMALHGNSFIDRIEHIANTDPVFRKMLGAVWKTQIPENIYERIKSVAGPSF